MWPFKKKHTLKSLMQDQIGTAGYLRARIRNDQRTLGRYLVSLHSAPAFQHGIELYTHFDLSLAGPLMLVPLITTSWRVEMRLATLEGLYDDLRYAHSG